MQTLEEAKQFLRNNWEKGVECPCCTQHVRLWKHSINSAIARTLIAMYRKNGTDWVHIMKDIHLTTMYGIAEFWELIVPKTENDEDKKSSGYWKLTERGRQFVTAQIIIPRYKWVFENKVRRTSTDYVGIGDCLGKKFNYRELMEG